MSEYFEKVKSYLVDLEYSIKYEDAEEEVFVVEHESDGIQNLVIACADPILIMEQFLIELPKADAEVLQALLIKNRDIVHGAFALEEHGKKLVFRDTLRLETLDKDELEGSINALGLLLSEYSNELIQFSKK